MYFNFDKFTGDHPSPVIGETSALIEFVSVRITALSSTRTTVFSSMQTTIESFVDVQQDGQIPTIDVIWYWEIGVDVPLALTFSTNEGTAGSPQPTNVATPLSTPTTGQNRSATHKGKDGHKASHLGPSLCLSRADEYERASVLRITSSCDRRGTNASARGRKSKTTAMINISAKAAAKRKVEGVNISGA